MFGFWQGVFEDFSDFGEIEKFARYFLRLILAAALGGVMGFERQKTGKSAGLRTHMIVALGSALFVVAPQLAGMSTADLSRVIQGIVAGIGFLGAGAILKQSDQREVHGLTTAAGIWLTAAVGITAGMGRELTAILATALALFILVVVRWTERWNKRKREGTPPA